MKILIGRIIYTGAVNNGGNGVGHKLNIENGFTQMHGNGKITVQDFGRCTGNYTNCSGQ